MARPVDDPLTALKRALRDNAPARLYVFYGEEVFLLRHYLDRLRKLLVDPATEAFNYHRLNGETFSCQALQDALEALPMMAERTFVWVDEVDLFKLPESDRDFLGNLLSDIPDYCTLVLTYETVAWKPDKRQKQLYSALAAGQIVEFTRQSRHDLIAWVGRHFASQGKRISSDLAGYLVDLTGGSMTLLSGEIAKISAYSGAEEIVKSDIDAVTDPVLEAVVFQMTDLLAQGAYGEALKKLQTLLLMRQEPLAILGAVGNHFRRLGAARTLLDRGMGPGELAKLYGLGDYPARKTMAAAGKFSPAFCGKAAELVLETDYRMKTSFDDPERLLEQLILELAQEGKNG